MLVGVVQAEGGRVVDLVVAGVHQEVAEGSEEAEVVIVVVAEVLEGEVEVLVEVIAVVVEEVADSVVGVATEATEDHEQYTIHSLSPFDLLLFLHIQKTCSDSILLQSGVDET